jgi:AcrR family transcriptional regulator
MAMVRSPDLDGREQRRINNAQRATEVMLELILETGKMPEVEAILERSGISRSSFFRYFRSEGARIHEANRLMARKVAKRFGDLTPDGTRSLHETLTLFVVSKSQIDEYRMPLRKLTEERRRSSPELAGDLSQQKIYWRRYVRNLFAPHLEDRPDAPQLLQHIYFNTSWITWASLREDFGMSVDESRRFIERQIRALFSE